jgi:curli production assembly/transport component CsgG
LLFAGVLLEGGVVGYDTNTVTGGVGATLLGIGGDAKYQQDTVTVYLRATSVKTGEVLTSITASKTITSYAVDANVFRYVGSTSLLETENGFTTNEPGLVALQAAIDKAVYGLILEGVDLKLWNFADTAAGAEFVDRYHQERSGMLSPQQVAALERRAHGGRASTPRPVILPAPDAGPQARNASGARTAAPASATTPAATAKTGWGRPVPWTAGSVKPDPAAAGASFAPPPAMSSTSGSDPIGDLIAELNSPQSAPRPGGTPAQFAPS